LLTELFSLRGALLSWRTALFSVLTLLLNKKTGNHHIKSGCQFYH
jgi:hypothetical protein